MLMVQGVPQGTVLGPVILYTLYSGTGSAGESLLLIHSLIALYY